MSQLLSMVFVNFLAWQEEGMKGVKACWAIPQGASIFIVIGLWYAFGDFLEMLSMGAMKGGVYQLLLQSKLLITAVMMMQLKGTKQSDLQWSVLVAATLAISAFVMVDSGSSDGDSGIPLVGVAMVLFKVGVSCYAAVLSDAKLKGFSSMSMSAKLSLMSLSRVIASVAIAAVMEPDVQPSYKVSQAAGFFDHWTMATWIVTLSFTSKSLIGLYLLKSLDGIQKNVGEALAVIVIFLGQIAAGSSVFNLCAFLLALLVVILVRIYGLAGKVAKPKAVEADKGKLGSSDVKLVGISNNANSPWGLAATTFTKDSLGEAQRAVWIQQAQRRALPFGGTLRTVKWNVATLLTLPPHTSPCQSRKTTSRLPLYPLSPLLVYESWRSRRPVSETDRFQVLPACIAAIFQHWGPYRHSPDMAIICLDQAGVLRISFHSWRWAITWNKRRCMTLVLWLLWQFALV